MLVSIDVRTRPGPRTPEGRELAFRYVNVRKGQPVAVDFDLRPYDDQSQVAAFRVIVEVDRSQHCLGRHRSGAECELQEGHDGACADGRGSQW